MDGEELSGTLGYRLAHVCKAHHFRVRQLLHEIGLYRGQQFVLCALWREEGVTHSELAEHLSVHPATVSNALRRMEQAGFLERRPDPEDQRISRVYLTPEGRDIRSAVERVWAKLEKETLRGFTNEERRSLESFLQRIHENLEKTEP